jgi:hypothetical protein
LINANQGAFQGTWAAGDFGQRAPTQVLAHFRELGDFQKRLWYLYDAIRASLETELKRVEYVGPVGIDAFVYGASTGACRLKPVVEINPRYTMGRLTIELMKRTCPGSCGLLRLVGRSAARTMGFTELAHYARALTQDTPVALYGEPLPKIRRGLLCLNEPSRARACLALFKVGRTWQEVLDNPLLAEGFGPHLEVAG